MWTHCRKYGKSQLSELLLLVVCKPRMMLFLHARYFPVTQFTSANGNFFISHNLYVYLVSQKRQLFFTYSILICTYLTHPHMLSSLNLKTMTVSFTVFQLTLWKSLRLAPMSLVPCLLFHPAWLLSPAGIHLLFEPRWTEKVQVICREAFPKFLDSGVYMHLLRSISDLQESELQHLYREPSSTIQAIETSSLSTASGKMKAISHIMPSMTVMIQSVLLQQDNYTSRIYFKLQKHYIVQVSNLCSLHFE